MKMKIWLIPLIILFSTITVSADNNTNVLICGDGICKEGENPANCKLDCNMFDVLVNNCIDKDTSEESRCAWGDSWTSNLFMVSFLIFIVIYYLKQNKRAKQSAQRLMGANK